MSGKSRKTAIKKAAATKLAKGAKKEMANDANLKETGIDRISRNRAKRARADKHPKRTDDATKVLAEESPSGPGEGAGPSPATEGGAAANAVDLKQEPCDVPNVSPHMTADCQGEYAGEVGIEVGTVLKNCNELRKQIRSWPDDWLVEIYESHLGIFKNRAWLLQDAIESIAELEQMAILGKEDAVTDLASLAVRISRFLSDLVGRNDDAIQEMVTKGVCIHREISADDKKAEAYRLLIETQDGLMKLSDAEFLGAQNKLTNNFREAPLLQQAIGMFRPENLLRRDQSTQDTKVESTATDEHGPLDKAQTDRRWDIDYLLASMFERRVLGLSREAVRNVLARSDSWPIVSEIRTGAGAKAMDLQVTSAVSVTGRVNRLPPPKKGNAQARDWANSIFLVLEEERQRWTCLPTREKKKWKLMDQKGSEFIRRMKEGGSECTIQELDQWSPSWIWRRKAALLPPPNSNDLDKWVDAGMAFLESQLYEDLEKETLKNYPDACPVLGNLLLLGSCDALCDTCRNEADRLLVKEVEPGNSKPNEVQNDCEACQKLRAEASSKYDHWLRSRTNVSAYMLKELDDRFDKHEWGAFFQRRAERRSTPLRAVVKEKLKAMVSIILSQRSPGPRG